MKPPIKNYIHRNAPKGSVSQWFGENELLYYTRIGLKGHNGIDIVAPYGTPIYAVEGGIIADVKDSPDGYGRHIRIVNDKHQWTYGHNAANLVKIGDEVKAGDKIALMGNSGFTVSSTNGGGFWRDGSNQWAGTHLHLGMRNIETSDRRRAGFWRYNPGTPYLKVLDYDNGYKGSVDFANMLGKFTKDEMGASKFGVNKLVDLLRRLKII